MWAALRTPSAAAPGFAAASVPIGAALALGGCEPTGLHPLYMSRGGDMQAILQSIAVDPIPDRFGHYLADKLVTDLKDRKSTRLNSSHSGESRMPSSA